jgi:membrane protein insertase Oxa1/YidC/SpoIIIJ
MTTGKDAKEETMTTLTSTTQLQREQQQAVYKTLDKARDEIKRSVNESRKEIPLVTEAVGEYQQQTIEAGREIADTYIESQKEIINSVQSAWSPLVENFDITNWNTVFSPGRVSEIYAYIVSSYADNLVTATKLANNVMFANMETFRTSLQQVKDSLRDLSKIGVNAAKTFEHTSAETVRLGNTGRDQ